MPDTMLAMECTPEWIQAAAPDAGGKPPLPRFSMVAYNGGPMRLSGFADQVVVDLAGMQIPTQRRPIRLQHDASMGVGHTEAVAIESGRLVASGVVSRDTVAAREVVTSGRNGFPWQASIGAAILGQERIEAGASATVNGQEIPGPLVIVRRSVLGEISFVDLGADGQTSARVAATKNQPTGSNVEPDTSAAPAATHPTAADTAAGKGNGDRMKITAEALAALVAAASPTYAHLIVERANAGDDEGSIKAALADKIHEGTTKALADANVLLAQKEEELKAANAALVKLQADHDALKLLAKGGMQDPGAGSPPAGLHRAKMTPEEKGKYQTEHGVAAYQKLPE